MEKPHIILERIEFNGGYELKLDGNDFIIIVGPNNSGKSATLRSLHNFISGRRTEPVVVNISAIKVGDSSSLSHFITRNTRSTYSSIVKDDIYTYHGNQFTMPQMVRSWASTEICPTEIADLFCCLLSAEERLKICNTTQAISLTKEEPTHPVHHILLDDALEIYISSKLRQSFGLDFIIHRTAGSEVPLYVGERPKCNTGEDRASYSYTRKIESLPELHKQGDGIRSFTGVLISTLVGKEDILLIDEPEAFLHPPQAKNLGRILINEQQPGRQTFVATHSIEILTGILSSENNNIRVIRLNRKDNNNTAKELNNDEIKKLWGDSLLRYSNVLNGLFHEAVIICESDSDCRFYGAMFDTLIEMRGNGFRKPDVMFIHSGGKERLPVLIKSLKGIGVPVFTIADFDILFEETLFKSLIESLNIKLDEVHDNWKMVKSSIDNKAPDFNSDDVKREVTKILNSVDNPKFPTKARRDIQSILKKTTPWNHVKTIGKNFLPSGQVSQAYNKLIEKLKISGLFVVEVGELESFDRTVGGHGQSWVNEVLKKSLKDDPDLESARKFVSEFIREDYI